jgi:hypothetical protein
MKERVFYLVDANVAIPLRNPFKIQKKLVETINFVPELLPDQNKDSVLIHPNALITKGETWMPDLDFLMENDSISRMKSPFSPSESFLRLMDDNDDKDEEDWDDDEDFDEDEEDDDEDWDDEDEDEDWDDEDDWDEDDEDEDDEDWEEEDDEE